MLALIFGKFRQLSAIRRAQLTSTVASLCTSVKNSESPDLVYSVLPGGMIGPKTVAYLLNHANTAIQLMEEVTSPASSGYSSSIDLQRMASTDYSISLLIAFLTLVSLEGGGIFVESWKTTILTQMSGYHLIILKLPKWFNPTDRIMTSSVKTDAEQLAAPTSVGNTAQSLQSSNSPAISSHPDVDDQSSVDDWEVLDDEVVFADCRGIIEPDILKPDNSASFLELESDVPLIQIGSAVFEGHYDDPVGTLFFLRHNSEQYTEAGNQNKQNTAPARPSSSSHQASPPLSLTKCGKCVIFDRVFLKPKESEVLVTGDSTETPSNPPN
ncbi:unnamed protein product [Calicophoron daubneyi]|uniref:Transcription factor TFIIIC triple barrel domain-containing protein n=1 Tax=Calicophoron daubneyi TaxID=300641 RepID=A0AAV2TDV1_CALDB